MALIPPLIQGLMAYWDFANSVQFNFRYFHNALTNHFLTDVLSSCSSRETRITPDRHYWRARLGPVRDENARVDIDDEIRTFGANRPYPSDQMKPKAGNWQSEGRANPRGISYLYLATNLNTALAEVRPYIGSDVSVGEFAVTRILTLIDCSKNHSGGLGSIASSTREEGFWTAIDRAFAKPVGRDDDVKDYIPTQILSEFFRSHGYDGIQYKSLLDDEGRNVALFSPNDASLLSCSLFSVTHVRYDYTDNECTYRTDPDPEG